MQVNYQYHGPSRLVRQGGRLTLGMSPDLSREEAVSFCGRLKNPLLFRDAMLMLREIVVADATRKKKERAEFFQWLNAEIEKRARQHEKNQPQVREALQKKIDNLLNELNAKDAALWPLMKNKKEVQGEIDKYDAWRDYYRLEKSFWQFIRERDKDLWFVLDPVITVHPDQVSFEAFSRDESIYGCLSIELDEFEMRAKPVLGTTNIDFSAKLAKEMERFRTYADVELSVNPAGFTVDTGLLPEHLEKKIDLPESWIKGFNQVSAAANLGGSTLTVTPADMYDLCSFLRRNKEKKSPRYMKWILEKNKPVRIILEPFGTELILQAVYRGEKNREEKIWGRRRWLVAEKLLPLAKSFQIKLLGFGLPQFVIADLGHMKLTIGFSSWAANDWVKGTAFNIMSGFLGEGKYSEVYALLKEKRALTVEEICARLDAGSRADKISGIGSLFKRGEGYFDASSGLVRFRRLLSEPLPPEFYATTPAELEVKKLLDAPLENFQIKLSENNEYIFHNTYQRKGGENCAAELAIDEDGQICRVQCNCQEFKSGPRNISAPCVHLLSLYITAAKFTRLKLARDKVYTVNDIMELLL